MEKYIHIHAKCQAFEIFELVSESNATKRLIQIRETFKSSREKFLSKFDDELSVKTKLVNPEFNF